MTRKKIALAAAAAGAVVAGGLAAAALSPLGLASAQDAGTTVPTTASAPPATDAPAASTTAPPPAPTAPADPNAAPAAPPAAPGEPDPGAPGSRPPGGGRHGHGGHQEAVSDASVAAAAIGISEADLQTAQKAGQSLADIAKAHNVDPQKVIDALVADEQAELDQAVKDGKITQAEADEHKTDIVARITDRVNHAGGPGEGRGPGGPGGRGPGGPGAHHLTAAATAIGIPEADLQTALRSGQSLADIAKAHNVDPQKVIDALVADEQTELDQAVKDAKMTQAQADDAKAHIVERTTAMVNGSMPQGPGGPGGAGGHGPGRHHGPDADGQAPDGQAPADSGQSGSTTPSSVKPASYPA